MAVIISLTFNVKAYAASLWSGGQRITRSARRSFNRLLCSLNNVICRSHVFRW
jgi:hypothetical protein